MMTRAVLGELSGGSSFTTSAREDTRGSRLSSSLSSKTPVCNAQCCNLDEIVQNSYKQAGNFFSDYEREHRNLKQL